MVIEEQIFFARSAPSLRALRLNHLCESVAKKCANEAMCQFDVLISELDVVKCANLILKCGN